MVNHRKALSADGLEAVLSLGIIRLGIIRLGIIPRAIILELCRRIFLNLR
jgi:hypothetical protein